MKKKMIYKTAMAAAVMSSVLAVTGCGSSPASSGSASATEENQTEAETDSASAAESSDAGEEESAAAEETLSTGKETAEESGENQADRVKTDLLNTWGFAYFPVDAVSAEGWSPDARGAVVDLTHDGVPEIISCTPNGTDSSISLVVYQFYAEYDSDLDDPLIVLYGESIGDSHYSMKDMYLYEEDNEWYLMSVRDTVYGGEEDRNYEVFYLDDDGLQVLLEEHDFSESSYDEVLEEHLQSAVKIIDADASEIVNLPNLSESFPSSGTSYTEAAGADTEIDEAELIGYWVKDDSDPEPTYIQIYRDSNGQLYYEMYRMLLGNGNGLNIANETTKFEYNNGPVYIDQENQLIYCMAGTTEDAYVTLDAAGLEEDSLYDIYHECNYIRAEEP